MWKRHKRADGLAGQFCRTSGKRTIGRKAENGFLPLKLFNVIVKNRIDDYVALPRLVSIITMKTKWLN